jgi:Lar family restriction alleviation protein
MLKGDILADDSSVAVSACPFCGSDDFDFIAPFTDLDHLCIQCRRCSSRGPIAETGREAMRLWNERKA